MFSGIELTWCVCVGGAGGVSSIFLSQPSFAKSTLKLWMWYSICWLGSPDGPRKARRGVGPHGKYSEGSCGVGPGVRSAQWQDRDHGSQKPQGGVS